MQINQTDSFPSYFQKVELNLFSYSFAYVLLVFISVVPQQEAGEE